MISAEYCRTMARYNAWQNRWQSSALLSLDDGALKAQRGAFFGSVLGTANHLLWGDMIWMSRFDGGEAPKGGIGDSPSLFANGPDWADARQATDARIRTWADGVSDTVLAGDLSWFSGALGRDVTKPQALCVTHFFNHQTHHRGQLHALLTGLGVKTQDTDLFIMPEDI